MQSEIGSDFDLDAKILSEKNSSFNINDFNLNGSDYALLSTGREAIRFVLDEIERRNPKLPKVSLVPSFTCKTVLQPFINKGYKIFTYDIDEKLRINKNNFKAIISQHTIKIVLIHQYFGFDTASNLMSLIKDMVSKDIIFIEDRTQCLYSDIPVLPVEFIVASIRKWGPLPDGGIAICKTGKFIKNKLQIYDKKLEVTKLEASIMKHQYLYEHKGNKPAFLNKFKEAEILLNSQNDYYEISQASLTIQAHLDLKQLKSKRRINYQRLYEGLHDLKGLCITCGKLDNRMTPLYFPMYTSCRDELQQFLARSNIYAPIIWPKTNKCTEISEAVKHIYETILCLPIDQRYDLDDMDRIINMIKRFFKDYKI